MTDKAGFNCAFVNGLNLENVIKYYEETIYLLISSKMFFS